MTQVGHPGVFLLMKTNALNLGIFLFLCGVNLWQFIILPQCEFFWFWTLIPLALASNSFWSAIHEAVHGNLFSNRKANLWGGRILSCLFGSSFTFLSAGHLTHHSLNRTEEQLEIIKPGQSLWKARISYYFFLFGGLYLAELLVPFVFLWPLLGIRKVIDLDEPFVASVYYRSLIRRRSIVIESICTLAFLSLSAYLYGDRWPFFLGILAARAFFISALDYIYHYGNPTGDSQAAFNLWLPRPLSILLLNFNLHSAHHSSPLTPWSELPKSEDPFYQDTFLKAALRVWKGPKKLNP